MCRRSREVWVAPADLASVIAFLASDAARAIRSAAAIPVTGAELAACKAAARDPQKNRRRPYLSLRSSRAWLQAIASRAPPHSG